MKDKIIIFLVGLFLGAVISTSSIYIYTIANNNGRNIDMEIPNDNRGQGGMMDNNDNTPPDMPNDNKNFS